MSLNGQLYNEISRFIISELSKSRLLKLLEEERLVRIGIGIGIVKSYQ